MKTGLPLSARLFLFTSLLLVVTLGTAIVITYQQGNAIAKAQLADQMSHAKVARQRVSDNRFDQLALIAELVAGDVDLVEYIETATGGGLGFGNSGGGSVDRRSALDLLLERQAQTRFDFAVLMDDQGEVLVRTDRAETTREVLTDSALVNYAVQEISTEYGLWEKDGALFEAVVTPLGRDFQLVGFMLAGFRINDSMSEQIASLTQTDIVFLQGQSLNPIAMSLVESEREAMTQKAQSLWPSTETLPENAESFIETDINGREVFIAAEAILDFDGEPLGAVLTIADRDALFGGYDQILNILLLAAAGALVLAVITSLVLSSRILRPVKALADAAESAAEGDYETELTPGGGAELAQLSQSFNSLLSDLREKNEMEGYVAELSKHLPDPANDSPTRSGATTRLPLGTQNRCLLMVRWSNATSGKQKRDFSEQLMDKMGSNAQFLNAGSAELLLAFRDNLNALRAFRVLLHLAKEANTKSPAGAVVAGESTVDTVSATGVPMVYGPAADAVSQLLKDSAFGICVVDNGLQSEFEEVEGLSLAKFKARSNNVRLAVDSKRMAAWKEADVDTQNQTVVVEQSSSAAKAKKGRMKPGTLFGDRFEIVSVLGAGGMGVVYKARDLELNDLVALKTLLPSALQSDEQIQRFKSEIKLARIITHPNVLRTFDFGMINETPFISMEYVRGLTLRYLLKRAGRLPYSVGLRLARQLCAGLYAAHEVGVIHRDIKPENIIVEQQGNAKLMDFGIARPAQSNDVRQTQPGMFVGTPAYSAPESLSGDEPDHRADIYSVGIVMCELFTGKLPFESSNTMELAMAHIQSPPTPPTELWDKTPTDLEPIILRCLAKKPEQRFETAKELGEALSKLRA